MEVCEKLLLASSRASNKGMIPLPLYLQTFLYFVKKTFRASTRKLKSNMKNFYRTCKVWFTTSWLPKVTSESSNSQIVLNRQANAQAIRVKTK